MSSQSPPISEPRSLVRLLRRRASQHPRQRAFLFLRNGEDETASLTWGELDQQARAIAARLAGEVGRGERALLLYPQGPEFVSALFGCLYAGVVAVPAPPPEPSRLKRTLPRVESILGDAEPAVVLTISTLFFMRETLGATASALRWIATDALAPELAEPWREPDVDPDALAYLQFTSGSTSAPRGVMATHRNLIHSCRAVQTHKGYTPESVAVIWVPNFHDDGLIQGALLPVYSGHCCVLMPAFSVVQKPLRWLRAISRYRATHSGGPNFIYQLAARKVRPAECRDLDLSSWTVAYNAAEPVRHETLVAFHKTFARYGFRWDAFYPSYGLAETTLTVSTGEPGREPALCSVDTAALEHGKVVESIGEGPAVRTLVGSGRPVRDTTVLIVDPESRQRCGPDEVGEIWVSGPSVARGYWRRPEATAETFRATPADGDGVFLRTGDLGFVKDGEIFVTGRFKDLILVRGRNVYPQDVELTVETSHPLLRPGGSAAFSVEGEDEERLVIVAEVDRRYRVLDLAAVVEAVRQAVSESHELSPRAVVLLEPGGLLKTSSGKVQRRACRQAFVDRTLSAAGQWTESPPEAVAASAGLSPEELPGAEPERLATRLRELAAAVLRVPSVEADQPLHRYGIDSLSDAELSNRVREVLGVDVPAGSFLRGHTLAELAARLAEHPRRAVTPITPVPRDHGGVPLSFAQQRLWFLDRLVPHHHFHNVPFVLRLTGTLDAGVLAAALGEIERRHETLRTSLVERAGKPVQVIRRFDETRGLPRVELTALGGAAQAEARRLAETEERRPFDLEAGPLFRAALVRLGDNEHLLLLTLHHAVTDGWSLGVLLRELTALYEAWCAGRPSPLPERKLRYADFAAWQRETLSREVLEGHLRYWRRQLENPPVSELPADRPRPAVRSFRGESVELRLPADLADCLRDLGRRQGATAAMTLLAGFFALLSRTTGEERVLVGLPVANRNVREVEELIGFFVNTLPIVGDLSGGPGFRELIGRVRETSLAAYAHQDLPFEKLVEELGLERDLSRNPLFQMTFALHNAPIDGRRLDGLTLEPLVRGFRSTRFDLEAHLWDSPEGFSGFCTYARDLFDRSTIVRLTKRFEVLLRGMAEAPDRPVAELPLLPAAELHQLVAEWSGGLLPIFASRTSIHEAFRIRARCRSDAVALVGDGEALTYGELDARSDSLARHLLSLDVGPEVAVGLFAERSPEMVVGILGILKAGGAYLPLDPGYPAERLAFILEDGRVPVLVTQERLLERLPKHEARVVCLDRREPSPGEGLPLPAVRPENLAYVIYTSGSTGRPKGVGVTHGNVMRLLSATEEWFHFGDDDVGTLFHSVAFDFSVWELYGALLYGGRLVVVPWEVSRSFDAFYDLVCRERVSVLNQTPSAFEHFVRAGAGRPLPPALRTIVFGAEALDPRKLRAWRQRHGQSELVNMYGITETTVHVTYHPVSDRDMESPGSPIGRRIPDLGLVVLDESREPVPIGVPGEIFVGGAGVARGYLGRPGLTAERFLPDPFSSRPGGRTYRTGDLARWLADGNLEYLGRIDHQVKIRGYRIELGEIEAVLGQCPGVRAACVVAREARPGDRRLVAYVVGDETSPPALRRHLRAQLPEYMVPAALVELGELPRLPNGKVNRAALPMPQGGEAPPEARPGSRIEKSIAEIWRQVLGRERLGVEENFFDLGGHSLALLEVRDRLRSIVEEHGTELPGVVELFRYPTIRSLAEHLFPESESKTEKPRGFTEPEDEAVAIVAMAGRFPGAAGVEELWRNLCAGVESISFFTDDELEVPVPDDSRYVKAGGVLEGVELFDADFFDFTPRDAALLDPQQRLFLECAWEALERSGHDSRRYPGRIGVFAGSGMNTYLISNLLGARSGLPDLELVIASDKDFLPTRVSYKLDLKGPSYAVQSACSTSLVAVNLACENLRAGSCEMALAGGVTVRLPQKSGYLYRPEMIASPDGHTRAFDANAHGTVGGNGVGVVVLKRLSDALADRNPIHAVIRGCAVNNDGSVKVGYTAPGVDGQAAVISEALARSGVDAETVGYVEAHGTATALGDPIEVAALDRTFGEHTEKKGFCALGSVKTNIGHLDAAAGVAGLIKTALVLEHGQIPPSLHFAEPNPEIDFASSPFYVNTELREWSGDGVPRRAGVSSFGIGGTNAHAVLEQAPAAEPSPPSRPWQLVTLSARTATALETATARLAAHLHQHPEQELADVAYTLAVGRRDFEHRRMVVGRDREEVAAALSSPWGERGGKTSSAGEGVFTRHAGDAEPPVYFLFPGQGARFAGMGLELYREEPLFRRQLDRCGELLAPHLGRDLLTVLGESLRQTAVTQPALFAVEYALARLWMAWGIRPRAMIGHSVGEYVAACLAGVFSLADALALVACRGRLMQDQPPGEMLAVPLSEEETAPFLERGLDLAAVNAPAQCVLSGAAPVVAEVAAELAGRGLESRRLRTSHAFHSRLMDAVLEPFRERVKQVGLRPPRLPFFSNLTGALITAQEATDPDYWVRHLRRTVRFGDAVAELGREGEGVLLEVGPGRTLGSLARRHPALSAERTVLASLPHATDTASPSQAFLLTTLGRLWLAGVPVDPTAFYGGEERRLLLLPTYPFERRRYWIEAAGAVAPAGARQETTDATEAPAPAHDRPALDRPYVAPAGERQQALAEIWQQVLGIARIGAHDDFFELGGHSLLATRVLSRIRETFGFELSLARFFEAATIAELARLAEGHRPGGGLRIPARARQPGEHPPASFAQQRLWFLDRLTPGNTFYNVPAAFRLRGALKAAILERVVGEIVRRHETLRTTFAEVDGEPVQVIHEPVPRALPLVELTALSPAVRETELRRLARDQVERPFDLAAGPLQRAVLLRSDREHVLLLTQHHTVSDGWSVGVFQRELATLYEAFANDRPSPLPELAIQYADFAVWQREWLRGELLDTQLGYWKQLLGDDPPGLELPTDRPRPAVRRFRGETWPVKIGSELADSLRSLSRDEGATLAMTLLAGFYVLLHRVTGQERILVGSPIAGRGARELEGLIGFFVNNPPLCGDLSGNPGVRDLLGRVRAMALEAYSHQDLPFEKLVEKLRLKRDLSRNPLFQVVFAFQNAPAALEFDGLELRPMVSAFQSTRFDVELHLWETPEGLAGFCSYDMDLFDPATIVRLTSHYRILLDEMAKAPDTPLRELRWLTAGERHQLLAEWNDTATGVSPGEEDRSLSELFEQQARKTPDAVALVLASSSGTVRQVSYGELDRRANRLALLLRRRLEVGLTRPGSETAVGICLERSPELVVGILGILKAGGFYVPLDPEYPRERLEWMLRDSRVTVVLTRKGLLPEVLGEVQQVFVEKEEKKKDEDEEGDKDGVRAGNLAYVMYTSGSTGRPKGVAVPHRGVVRLVRGADFMNLSPEEVFLQLAPTSFDASTLEIWGPLLNGGRLVVFPPGIPSLAEVAAALRRYRVSSLWLTAGLFHQMVDEELTALAGVRQLLAGGDVLSPAHVRRVLEQLPARHRLINGYGPTENTTFTTCHPMTGAREMGETVPIGRPIRRTRVMVLDAHGQPVPIGVPGELLIGGAGVARGYHDRPALSAERFVPDPTGRTPGGRLYRTGDLVRYLADGRLEFGGRLDHQVKVRGFRIELGEIETVLAEHPAVREAVVVARDDAGGRRLVAYVTLELPDTGPGELLVPELRDALRRRLPEYMVPAAIVVVEEFPLTPSGKIDRAALPAVAARGAPEESYVAPRTPMEELLVAIWGELLGPGSEADRLGIGVNDDFFELGGHSLLATRVISRIRERLGVEPAVRELFEAPTVATLARRLDTARQAAAPPIVRRSGDGEPPLSFAQERLWFLDQLEPGSAFYNVSGVLRLSGALSVEALRRTFEEIVRRHEVLRTNFASRRGRPVQVIAAPAPRPLPLVELVGLGGAGLQRLLRREAVRPFDLERDPLLRTILFRLEESEYVLLLVMHHIVSDAWSMGILVRELGLLYTTFRSAPEAPAGLPEPAIRYADFAVWQRRWLSGSVLEQQLGYWKSRLAGTPPLELPADRPRPPVRSYRGGLRTLRLPAAVGGELRRLSRREGTTLFMTLLAAFQVLLSRCSGQTDVAVGTPIANRGVREIEELVGFFVNTLVLRTELTPELRFRELLARVRDQALAAYAHQDLPFESLVDELAVERDLSRTPLFQVMFALQNAFADELRLPDLRVELEPVETGTSKFDLTLEINDAGDALAGTAEYSTELFDATTVARMMQHFEVLLRAIPHAADGAIAELPLLTDAQRRQLLAEWNDTGADASRDRPLDELFERQAGQTPDAVALVAAAEQVSYGELDRRASRLARLLRHLGVGPETAVGICLERSIELVVGLLGILKAGGFYVPLDPEYPRERLEWMLRDSLVTVVVTRKGLLAEVVGEVMQVFVEEEEEEKKRDDEDEEDKNGVWAGNLAYVMYTSGSTGRSKGVAVPHRGVVRLVRETNFMDLSPETVFLLLAPTSFDASTLEIWGPLANGGRLVVFPPGVLALAEVAVALRRYRINALWLTAGLFHQMVDEELPALAEVRQLLAGGDVLSPIHVRRVLAQLRPGSRLINGYGPTENTTFTTCHPMTAAESLGESVPIGRPIRRTRVLVVDRRGRPVPAGVEGELLIDGDGLARGYYQRPALSAERFVPDPTGRTAGGRLYRTGDLVRYRADGGLEFRGRLDYQVKVRGFRIELGEIETVLAEHPAVREAVVVAPHDDYGRRLAAYVTLELPETGPRELLVPELRAALRRRLPGYMVPPVIVVVEEFPRTPSGKTDRAALPAVSGRATPEDGYVAPRTPVEELLVAIWDELLGPGSEEDLEIGVNDDFFELGGHSLLATRVISRIRERLGVEPAVRELFEAPTVAALARRLEAAQRGAVLSVVRRSGDGEPPLSFAQERLWFLDQLEPGSAFYNVSGGLRLTGMLSVEALRRTFEEIVRRHEGLRTNFASRRGRPVQVITAPTPRPLPLVELVGMGGAGLRRLLRREAARPFDLERNPLLRTILFRLDDREHVLLLVMHHIVSDAWSMGILVRELGLLYAAFRSAPETPAGLSEPAIRYADFAVWQRQWLSGPVLEQQLGYWKSRLAGTPPLELPADRGRPPVRSYRGGLRTFRLPAATVGELRRLSRREGTTLFMTLLAAFQVLLSRCSGQTDVAVGTPIANRGVREIEDLVGFFVNTLVLRTELRPELRFRELLARVRDQALGAYAHQDLPFEYLVDELEVERDLSRTPLFQVMFALQNAFAGELRLPDLRVEPEPVETGTSKFDLTLAIDQDGDALAGMAEYSTELYDATTVARMMQHFEVLLREIPRAVDGTIADLPLLAAAQRHQLLVEWNDPHAFPAPWSSIHEIFAARAARAPDAVALVDGDVRLSYAELDGRAERLARMLRETSAVGPELRVGLLAERSAEMVVGILAVLKAGGAYVPLDPAYPPDRLAFILEDGRVPVLLTQQQLLDRLPEHGARVVCLDRDVPAPGENRPLPAVRPANVAYVIYTSGSTGRPKGVEVTHANGTRLFSATEKWFHFGEDDVWSLFHSVAFDFSVWEIFGALLYGGRLVIVPWEVSRSFGAFYDLVCRERVSVLNQTPSAFAQFVRAGAGRPLPPALRAVVFGGEALDPRKLRRWRQRHPDSELVNMYGITETTVHVTYHPVSDADIKSPGSPIGRRIPDLGLTLLQGFSQPVPIGVAGQIFVTGAGVARGYLGRPGLSAERFLPDPFSAAPGRRMYQTGDLGRFLPDGKLEFLGRIDHQVKMRGYRIELGEIEAVLGEHPAVRAACVVAPETRPGEHRLVAYVVGEKAPPKRLREHLKAKLPEYMVPAVFVALEALPRLPTGKIDRAALSRRALPAERPSEQLCVAPRTPVEELVAGIWAELLDSGGDGRAIGVDDDFFALGGHSLLATQVISRLRQSLGVEVAVRELFEAPTLAALAGRVEAARRSATSPPIVPRRGQGPPPLSFAQQRLWFLDRLAPGNIFYNMPVALRLRGPLTIGALERSLSEIVSRHQTLRTTFATVDGEPVQVIHAAAPRFLPRVELTALSAQAQEVEARRLAREEAERPFDLVAGPLFRAALLHLADAEQVLLLTQHHILADGWSVGVFQRELAALYAAFADHRTPAADLPELPIQYADFAVWQREWLRAEVLDSQLTWWKAQLGDDLPILELPTDRPRPAVRNFRGGVLPVRFEASLSDSLRSLSRQQGATLAMTLLAGFYTLLYRITGQEKIPVGGPIAGRNRREIEDLIGFFVNNLTLVGDLSGQPTFPELLGRVREMALGAYTHQDLPFERLVEELGLRRDLSRNPLFQVIFAVQNAPPEEWTLAGLSVRPLVSGFQSARFDLELSLGEEGEQLHGFCACDRVLFDATTVARWMNHYRRLLEAIVTDPETELTRLPWLAAGERHQLLVEWNGASRPPGDEVGATGRPRFRNASV